MRCVHRRGKGICLSCARRERRGCISCRGPRLKSGLREGLETLEDTDAGDFPNQDADQLLKALRNRLNLDYISDIPGAVGGKNTAAAPEIFTWAERFPRGMGKSSPLYCNIPAGASLAERWSLPQPGPGEFISRRDPRKRLSAVTERSTRGVLEYRNDLKLQAISGILKACGGHRHRLSISRAWICGVFALQASSDMSGGSGEVKTRRSPVKGWVSASRAEWSAGREMSSGRSVP